MDPCDLRLKSGDDAVRELVDGRVPLYRFVLENIVGRHDLDRADSRVDALREAAALVASVRDKSKVAAFTREVATSITRKSVGWGKEGPVRLEPGGGRPI